MSPNLLLALELTLVGMGLVFGSILLFWGLMAGLVRLTAARTRVADDEDAGARAAAEAEAAALEAEDEARRTAAALAVAALIAQDGALPRGGAAPAGLSAWRAAARVGRG